MENRSFQRSENSTNHRSVSETVIEMPEQLPDLDRDCLVETAEVVSGFGNGSSCSERSCVTENVTVDNKKSWVVDVKFGDGEICDGEKVCRICHLNDEQPVKVASSKARSDLIKLGCGCRGELSVAHSNCAEAWFKLKGNWICEICGERVDNVRGLCNESFLEEWKDNRVRGGEPSSSERSEAERCRQGQPLCNFIMACLAIAFFLPWFFHINFWR